MSRRPPQPIEQRIRELARQQPGWTPSQVAIFLQGEKLKVTNEDVRRVLARPDTAATDPTAEAETPAPPRYTAPREERRSSSIPVGIFFGVLLFVYYFAVQSLAPVVGAGTVGLLTLLGFAVLLVMSGAVASRRFANGPRAGALAGLIYMALTVGSILLLASTFAPLLQATLNRPIPTADQVGGVGPLAFGVAVLLVIFGVFGAILGWIGARAFGRRKRRAAFG
jgi:hypothetical protein